MTNNSKTYATELQYLYNNINKNVRQNDDKNVMFKKIFNYINSDGSVDLLDLNNQDNFNNFTTNITTSNIMKSFILNTSYYDNTIPITNRNYDFLNNINPWAMYFAEDYDTTNKRLYDCSGNNRHASATGNIIKKKESGNGANSSIDYIQGDNNCSINFSSGSIPTNFTIASITRYVNGGTNKRILQGYSTDWLHGHSNNNTGVCKYGVWETQETSVSINNWVRTIGKNGNISNRAYNVLIDGFPHGTPHSNHDNPETYNYGSGSDTLTINDSRNTNGVNEYGSWALSCVIIFDKCLSDTELIILEGILNDYMNNNIKKSSLLIKNTGLVAPSFAFNQVKYKYQFLLHILSQLYQYLIPFSSNLLKTDINNLLKNDLVFKTYLNASLDSNNNLILIPNNDTIVTNITMNDLYNVDNNTTNFIKRVDNNGNSNAYNILFNTIKNDLLLHLNFIKLYDMFNAKIYFYYYNLCSAILIYNIDIFANIHKIINPPYNYTPTAQGSIVNKNDYSYIIFNNPNANYNIFFLNNISCQVLIVGGGGGGGNHSKCGGGGGGGDVIISTRIISAGNYKITVGNYGSTDINGSNSSIVGITDNNFSIVANGGQAGGINGAGGNSGGSGGGNGGIGNSCTIPSTTPASPYTAQVGIDNNNFRENSVMPESLSIGNIGSNGTLSDITGTPTYYGGGGGGGSYISDFNSSGGQGGGGVGGCIDISNSNGRPNSGGGGGGGSIFSNNGGNGGSGVVIIKLATSDLVNINMRSNDVYSTLTSINQILGSNNLDPNENIPIVANMYNVGKLNKEMTKINMNIKRKYTKYNEYENTINTGYIELLAIAILSITIIATIYLAASNNNQITITYGSTLLLITIFIFIVVYIYLYNDYNLNENFDIQYQSNNINLFINTFQNINRSLNNSLITNIGYITNQAINSEKEKYSKMIVDYNVYDKSSSKQLKMISLENKKKANIIILLFIISIIILSSIILYAFNNNNIIFIIISAIIIFILSIYFLYINYLKYVHTDNNKYYWGKTDKKLHY